MANSFPRGDPVRSSTISTNSSRNRGSDHEEFLCTICLDFYDQPVRTTCNHLFCSACLAQVLSIKPECPFCREPLNNTEFKAAPDVTKKMQTKLLRCDTCKQKFKPIDGRAHEAQCMTMDNPQAVPVGGAAGYSPAPASGLGLNVHVVNRQTFPCAYCGQKNFPREDLINHCLTNHQNAPNHKLVCTICIAYPWGDKNLKSGQLLDHLKLRHKFDYDRFVDMYETEEESLQDILQSSTFHH